MVYAMPWSKCPSLWDANSEDEHPNYLELGPGCLGGVTLYTEVEGKLWRLAAMNYDQRN